MPAAGVPQPKMSTRVLLESLGLGQYYRFFAQAGMSMIDAHTHWSDMDVEDILNVIERRTGYNFAPKERVLLWKALRLMWARGPGHDCPFIQSSEVPGIFLPKRDWRQMDSDVKWMKLEPDRQRQVLRKKKIAKGGKSMIELQFEIYIRQQDIFYELKDVQQCVQSWMKSDPRKMLREDPREEAMKLRIRTMLDASAGYLQVRKGILGSKRNWAIFFLLCRMFLFNMSMMMFMIGYMRFSSAPKGTSFFYASGQFRSGTSFMLAYWVAFLVADRTKEDYQQKRFQRIIIALERFMEEISSFRVETDHVRMEEHEAVQRNESALLSYEQSRTKMGQKADAVVVGGKPKRRRKKKVDKELSAWAPGVKLDNMEEFKLKTTKAIEESYKRLPRLPENFRRQGGNRMLQFEDRGQLGGVDEMSLHVKAPWQMFRGEPRPTEIEIIHPSLRANPLPRRPAMPPPPGYGQGDHSVAPLQDLRHNAYGDTPPMGMTPVGASEYGYGATPSSAGGWDLPPQDLDFPDDEVAPRMNLREAIRTTSGSLPGSRARTHSYGVGTPRGSGEEPLTPPVGRKPSFELAPEMVPEEVPPEPTPAPSAKAKRSRRRGSKDVPDEAVEQEQQAGAAMLEGTDLRAAATSGEHRPLPPPTDEPE